MNTPTRIARSTRPPGSDAGTNSYPARSSLATLGLVLSVSASLLLGGCAADQAFRDGQRMLSQGQLQAGLGKLQEAVKIDPHNAEYRLVLAKRKLELVTGFNQRGDAARSQGALDEAEKWYRQTLAIEAANLAAEQGMTALQQDRRHQVRLKEAEALLQKNTVIALQDALDMLRPVLLENPQNRAALALKARIMEQQVKLKPADSKLAGIYRKPITLEFRDAPLRSVFDLIGKVSGLNFFFDKEVNPQARATILTRNTPIEEAVRMLLATNALEQTIINDNSVLVYPNTPQKVKDYQQLVVRTFFLANGDVKTVSYTIKTLLKARDIVTDDRLGLIIMRDTPEMIRMAERLIEVQDLSDPEVMLDVEVLEVKRSRLLQLGIQWPDSATLTLAGSSKSTTGVNQLTLSDLRTINRGNINLNIGSTTLNAKKEDADSNILANPRIRVRNKEKAKIMIGDRVPIVTATSTATGFVADSVNYVDVGLRLDVEPNIYLDGEVGIKLGLEVSNIVREVTSKSGTQAYQIGTRNANTVLRLKDGETQVLAGLINDEDRSSANKVPGVGELPVLSRIFGSRNDFTTRSEIVLSITPHILRSIRRPDLEAAEFLSGSESNVGGRALSISGASSGSAGNAGTGGVHNAGRPPRDPGLPALSPMTGGSDDPDAPPPIQPPQSPQQAPQPAQAPQPGQPYQPVQPNAPVSLPPPPPPQPDPGKGPGQDAPLKPKR